MVITADQWQGKNFLMYRKTFKNKSACYWVIFQNVILILSKIFLKLKLISSNFAVSGQKGA